MEKEKRYSNKIFLSFALGNMLNTLLGVVFDTRLFIFYETEVGLPAFFLLIAFIIYGIWNMINDPFIGFLSDRPNKLWKRWGRRFPWILIGAMLYCILFLFLFTPPSTSNILFLFIWVIFITCLIDFLLSTWNTNYFSLLPDKFRSQEERTKIGGIGTILGIIGITIGTLIPPMIIKYGNKESYFIAAGVIALIGILIVILMIPGIREDEEMIARAFIKVEDETQQSSTFWKQLRFALKQKNFVAFIIVNTAWQIVVVVMIASIPYMNQYIFKQPASSEIFITAALLIGSIGSVPLWVKFARKRGNRLTVLVGMLLMAIAIIPLLFVTNVIGAAITTLFIGFGNGAIYIGTFPMLSDVIDEIVVTTNKRQEGIYVGIRTFFMRLSYISQAIIFVTIHVFTGFNPVPGAEQTDLALWGIRIHTALIPMIILIIGALFFWKFCDLMPDKVQNIKDQLKDLRI